MAKDDSTLIRRIVARGLIVGPEGAASRIVAKTFMRRLISAEMVKTGPKACEELAKLMPQVVVVLCTLREDERAALVDRVTAVGALLMHIDPSLDEETVQELADRASAAAIERKQRRDDSEPPSDPAAGSEAVDADWDSKP